MIKGTNLWSTIFDLFICFIPKRSPQAWESQGQFAFHIISNLFQHSWGVYIIALLKLLCYKYPLVHLRGQHVKHIRTSVYVFSLSWGEHSGGNAMRQAVYKPCHRTARQMLIGSRLSSVAVSKPQTLFDFHMEVQKGDSEWVIPLWKASICVSMIL